jgi:molybdate transport system substrate-binding protein
MTGMDWLRLRLPALLLSVLLLGCGHVDPERPQVHVMTSGGFTAAFDRIAPDFETESGNDLIVQYGASIGGAPDSIPARLGRGEPADVVILARQGINRLVDQGLVDGSTVTDLVRSQIGMAIRAGADPIDISTPERFSQALLQARRIGYSASASGTYLAEELFPRLEIYPQIRDRLVRVESERVAQVVARGEIDIGFQQVSEILPIQGAQFSGLLPDEYQRTTIFSAGITTRALQRRQAERLLEFLTAPRHAQVIRGTGLEPINTARGN